MACWSVSEVSLAGLSVCVPSQIASNRQCELLTSDEQELLIKTTGIEFRRVAGQGVCASDLCHVSAEKLLEQLKWHRSEIDVLVFVSQTADYITPASAPLLQHRLGLSKNCLAFDINLGCSGYVYGLATVANFLSNIPNGKGLLLVGDVSTACISPKDKSIIPLFSDAGSASALTQKENAGKMSFNLQTDGAGFEAIMIPQGGFRIPVTPGGLEFQDEGFGIRRSEIHLRMSGIDIFNFAISEAPSNVDDLLQFAHETKDSIDYFVFHQANLLINETLRKKMNLSTEKVPYSLRDFGNTSSATIPLTMVNNLTDSLKCDNLKLILSGFGVGLSWGSAIIQTDNPVVLPIIEL